MSSENVGVLSVRDLLRRRCGDPPDIWHLALVQRDEVWDQVRMRYLLDSLLNGYPIGSLLVCKTTGQSRVIRLEGGERVVAEADRDSWQLLDGQQRINALFSMLTPDVTYGHFYLQMVARHNAHAGPVTSRRGRDDSVRYIHWQEEPEVERALPDRDRYIDLSRFYRWAESDSNGADASALALADRPAEAVRIINAIDPEFANELEAD